MCVGALKLEHFHIRLSEEILHRNVSIHYVQRYQAPVYVFNIDYPLDQERIREQFTSGLQHFSRPTDNNSKSIAGGARGAFSYVPTAIAIRQRPP